MNKNKNTLPTTKTTTQHNTVKENNTPTTHNITPNRFQQLWEHKTLLFSTLAGLIIIVAYTTAVLVGHNNYTTATSSLKKAATTYSNVQQAAKTTLKTTKPEDVADKKVLEDLKGILGKRIDTTINTPNPLLAWDSFTQASQATSKTTRIKSITTTLKTLINKVALSKTEKQRENEINKINNTVNKAHNAKTEAEALGIDETLRNKVETASQTAQQYAKSKTTSLKDLQEANHKLASSLEELQQAIQTKKEENAKAEADRQAQQAAQAQQQARQTQTPGVAQYRGGYSRAPQPQARRGNSPQSQPQGGYSAPAPASESYEPDPYAGLAERSKRIAQKSDELAKTTNPATCSTAPAYTEEALIAQGACFKAKERAGYKFTYGSY